MAMEQDSINMSLDEIIARQKTRGPASKKFAGGGGGRFSRGGFRGAQPRGRGGGGPVFKSTTRRSASRFWSPRTGEKLAVVNISNLGPMVNTADLEELFSDYPYVDCTVQYDETGHSMGTAIVIFRRFDEAMSLKRAYTGVKLDGRVIDMYVVSNDARPRGSFSQGGFTASRGTSSRFGRLSAKGNSAGGSTRASNMGGFVAPSGDGAARGGGGGSGKRRRAADPRNQMTTEELDRELDAYMRSGRHVRVVAP